MGNDLVFDPGVDTGVALMAPGTVYWTKVVRKLLEVGDVFDFATLTEDVDRVVYEDYRIFPGKAAAHIGSQVYPIQVIGVIRFLAYRHHLPVETLEPSCKAYISKEEFAAVMPEKLPTEHENDSVLLGLYQQRRDALKKG